MSTTMRVLTFNLRLDVAQDGPYSWPRRRESVCEFLNTLQPAVAGLQEVLPNMWDDLSARLLNTYQLFGEPRQPSDEAVPILYDRNQVTFLEGGVFWLSKTPDVKASKDPDAGCIRITTWARFARIDKPKMTFRVYNTHLDHQSEAARLRGLELTLNTIKTHQTKHREPLILMGDFNALPDSIVFKPLIPFNDQLDSPWRLLDVQADAPNGHKPTFHRFTNQATEAIDHIFVSRCLGIQDVQLHKESTRTLPLSDHHPISVLLDISSCL